MAEPNEIIDFDQPAKKPEVFPTDEVAGIGRDYDLLGGFIFPGKSTGSALGTAGSDAVLLNPDPVLHSEGKGRGIRIYEDVTRDPHTYATLQTRFQAVVGAPWNVQAASESDEDKRIADDVKSNFLGCNFRDGCLAILDKIPKGFSVVEVMWERRGSEIRIGELRGRAAHRFVFDLDGRPRLLTLQSMITGEELPERKFLVSRWGATAWNPYGLGLGGKLWWPVWFKKHGIKYWMIFAEKFGSPTVMGKYPPGTPPEQQQALAGAIEALQQETGIKMPNTMDISLLEAARTSSINTYKDLCDFMNQEISKTVLGQTQTTQIGKQEGSRASSQVHDDVRQLYLKADAEGLSADIDQLIEWYVDLNFPAQGRTDYPHLAIQVEQAKDTLALAQRDQILVATIGLDDVPKSYFHKIYDLPVASADDPAVVPPAKLAPAPAAGGDQAAAFSEAEKKSPNTGIWSRGSGGLTGW